MDWRWDDTRRYCDIRNAVTMQYSCILLGNRNIPTRLVLLKRSAACEFAPNLYTGIGGKFEEGETPMECAYRELKEEAGLDVPLQTFGKLTIAHHDTVLYYFFGLYQHEQVPECNEGTLEWTGLENVLEKDIIPTTRYFIEEWKKRDWSLKPFSVIIERHPVNDIWAKPTRIDVVEGVS